MKGKMLVIGAMNVDGEELCGVFVECTVDELKKGKNMFAEEVYIVPLRPKITTEG